MVVAWIWISKAAEIIKLSALLYFGIEIQCTTDLVCNLIRMYRNEDKDICCTLDPARSYSPREDTNTKFKIH